MDVYRRTKGHLFCGWWNGSPLEVGMTSVLREVPASEALHCHDYHEYYVVLEGRAELEVEGQKVPLEADTVVMVGPGERHRVTAVDPELGVKWVIVKARSAPETKIVVDG